MRVTPLPEFWWDASNTQRPIKRRVNPYYMGTTLDVAAATDAAVTSSDALNHNIDLPFEILRWMARITTYVTGTTIQSDPAGARVVGDELYRWVRMKIEAVGKARAWMKSMQYLTTLMKGFDNHVELDAPYYLESGQGFTVTVDNKLTAALAGGGIRFEIGFHGNLFESG